MKKKWYLLAIITVILVIQFIRIDKNIPEAIPENDFLNITKPNTEIAKLIKNNCYDCHSYETSYPWYAEIAPVSWYIKHHIEEGRRIVNFSEWSSYSGSNAKQMLEICAETIEIGTMPLSLYTLMHKAATSDQGQLKLPQAWFSQKANE